MSSENVSTEALIQSLGAGADFGLLKRLLKDVDSANVVDDSIPEAQLKRQQRSHNRDVSTASIMKFNAQVRQTTRGDQIDFVAEDVANKGCSSMSSIGALCNTLVPTTDFENEFRKAMEESGIDWNSTGSGAGAIPVSSELQQHRERSQMARVRTLLRAEQIRNRHLKKIKSKTYRRLIRKKEMKGVQELIDKLDKEDPDVSEQIRAELQTKLSSLRLNRQRQARLKWTQAAQRFGGREIRTEISRQAQADLDERRALVRAIKGKKEGDDGSSDDSDGESSPTDSEDAPDDIVARVKKQIQPKVATPVGASETTGLMGMKFMREAHSRKKADTLKEADEFLANLEEDSADTDAEPTGEQTEPVEITKDQAKTGHPLSQEQLVASLFGAQPEVENVSAPEKSRPYKLKAVDHKKDEEQVLPGWGAWVGEGTKERRKKPVEQLLSGKPGQNPRGQKSAVMSMAASESLKAPLMKYQVKNLPYPYQSVSEYERITSNPLGPEWQSLSAHTEAVKPRINAKVGSCIPAVKHVKNLAEDKRAKIIDAWDNRKKTVYTKARLV